MDHDVAVQITLFPPSADEWLTDWTGIGPDLWRAGLIWYDSSEVAVEGPRPELRIWCTFQDSDALETWQRHPSMAPYAALLARGVEVLEVMREEGSTEVCDCEESSEFALEGWYGFYRTGNLLCLDCRCDVPGYRVYELVGETPSRPDLVAELNNWAIAYGDVYRLWYGPAALERWASEQLCAAASPLNEQGLRLARAIAEKTARPCWYVLQQPLSEDCPRNELCPSCGGACARSPDNDDYFVCETCVMLYRATTEPSSSEID